MQERWPAKVLPTRIIPGSHISWEHSCIFSCFDPKISIFKYLAEFRLNVHKGCTFEESFGMGLEIIYIVSRNNDVKIFSEVSNFKGSFHSFPVTACSDSHRKFSIVFFYNINNRDDRLNTMLFLIELNKLLSHYLFYCYTTFKVTLLYNFISYYPSWRTRMLS